ncbi:MAG: hypothetical protein A3E02_02080 [Candidatus Zambryskibacteria bacterium RIFCSPHIGHO2_12_FULL_38_34]|uniref:Uncharacterized protein n=1 Tax=Candidatus Zambryskibacteria bacterium RIFCSPLOWO2_12_FULL_39_16 TaxID=1802775 RepID=A0A1G2UR32_9BACT|nr:MAG: hypothetical protein A3D37_01900 [Candidatus Zambryskibacteria bacterium RIFCSPHIGHO2_02_FULL_38_22]OHA97373.1 MAG: hypothetical protein A3E02_02080 [Candidatus Zambryskibacteria bacterium RIFCSPHIGHO2_12_FULL_38_34]OHB08488.1 MAG: hypothetical protein A3I19_00765 [Candidatus Zambryskibacteria bacterium RIFCSPLOWO2_02_FULL_38_13]OHB11847.1 MAG: hypothetical protein A3G46_01135 [Candidatus Zambryskibacteria bacterium RIFCSPLOWO2_12_FULL_39_16]
MNPLGRLSFFICLAIGWGGALELRAYATNRSFFDLVVSGESLWTFLASIAITAILFLWLSIVHEQGTFRRQRKNFSDYD